LTVTNQNTSSAFAEGARKIVQTLILKKASRRRTILEEFEFEISGPLEVFAGRKLQSQNVRRIKSAEDNTA
jgi:hypothetical protein